MKKLSKILVLVLAVALICTGLVLAVSADESAETEYTFDLSAAITAAEAGSTVTLTGNARPTSVITIDKNITIDLNGYTLSLPTNRAFSITKTCTFTITGEGTIIADGTMIHVINNSAAKAPTVNIKGTGKGIDLNHTGAYYYANPTTDQNCGLIIYSQQAGTFNIENVDIVSDVRVVIRSGVAAGDENNQRGAMFRSDEGVAGTQWNFNRITFYRDVNPDTSNGNFQDTGSFVYIAGASAKATINDSVIKNSGPLVNVAYMQANTDPDHVFAEINNSHMEVIVEDGATRISALTCRYRTGERAVVGTMKINNSYFGGQVYRVFYGIAEGFKVIADNSVIANLGANDTNGSNDTDYLLMRAGQLTLKNNSTIVTSAESTGTALVMNGSSGTAHLYAEVGTRFSSERVGNNTKITWIDKDGNTVDRANVRIILDPIGNSHYPYVSTTDTTVASYNHLDADRIDMFAMEYGAGRADGNKWGWQAEKDKQISNGYTDFTWAFQGSSKAGAFTDVTYGDNTVFKWWVSPLADGSLDDLGTTRTFTTDPYMIFGDISGFAENSFTAFAKIAETKVAVFEMDIATDSDYGFPLLTLQTNARTTTGSGKTGGSYATLNPDGTFTNISLTDFNSDIKLSLDKWNHLTVVIYTDNSNGNTAPTGIFGQTYVYVDGELLGYYNGAYTDGATYIQGVRFNIQKTTHTIGQSILFDNFMRRAYDDYAVEGEADGAAKSPSSYLITDIPANTNPTNDKIQVNGFEYADIASANAAANAYNATSATTGIVETIDLNGNIVLPYKVDFNVDVYHNGYTFNADEASYGFAVDGDKYTFNEDYWYNAYWYNGPLKDAIGMADDANYIKEVVKLGFELDRENLFTEETKDFTLLQSITQDGWAYDYLATEKVTALVPGLAELEAAKGQTDRVVRFYPTITGVDMIYCVKNAGGEVIDGGVAAADATAALKALADGNTFVLLADLPLTESNLLFASTADAPKVLNVDLNGNDLIRTVSGVLIQVGAYTTLNVYSSVAGASVVVPLANENGILYDGGTAFVISDGTNNSAWIASNTLVGTRGDVNEAYINVGKFGDIPGSNMTLIAERAYYGFKGGENCAIVADGVNVVAPGTGGSCAVDSYVYDGEIYVKNSILLVPQKDSVVNLAGFSTNCKNAGARNDGFEDFIITSYTEFENVIIINNLAGLSNGANNNVISNNGDTSSLIEGGTNHVALKFKNVVSTGRFNPSNEASRTRLEGFVAAETHAVGQCVEGTRTGNYNHPMTFDLIEELGITSDIQSFALPGYNTATGEVINLLTYNIANNGVSVEGLENAYVLPILDRTSGYSADFAYVNWKKLDGSANALSEVYYKGGIYKTLAAENVPTAATVNKNAVSLVADGAWTGVPAAGTVITENVNVTHGYKVQPNISGLKANLSLYSDFVVNVYIPADYAQYVTAVNGAALSGDTVTIGEKQYYKVTASKVAKEASDAAVFEIALAESGYTAAKTVNVSITDYASTILAGEFTDADKILMYNMLSFVGAASKYFEGAEDTVIAGLLETYAAWNKVSVDKSYRNALEDTGLGGVFTSAGIVLGDAPAFTLVPNGNFAGTVNVTYGDGNVRTYTVNAGSTEAIKIEGMKIFNFGVNINITAVGTIEGVDGEQTVAGTLNLDTYAKYQTANAEESVVAVVEALYNYVKVAEQYKAGTLVIPEA